MRSAENTTYCQTLMGKRLQVILPITAGILTAMAFLPGRGFMAWFSLIPAFYAILYKSESKRWAALYSLLFGLLFYSTLLLWIYKLHPLQNVGIYGIKSVTLVFLAWAFLTFILAAVLACALFLLYFFKNGGLWTAMAGAALFVLAEWTQGLGVFAMPWGRLAVSQYLYPDIIGSGAFFGSLFISFIIALFNLLLAKALKRRKYALLALLVFGVNILIGLFPTGIREGEDFTAAAVWVDIPPSEKMSLPQVSAAKDQYIKLSNKAAKFADLILWPETAVPVNPYKGALYIDEYRSLAKGNGATILASGFYEEKGINYSAVYAVSPGADTEDVYGKRRPVPFGEYIPYRFVIEFFMSSIEQISPKEDEVSPWKSDRVLDISYGKVGGLICFDSVFPALARQSTLGGAEILCVSTNDSWFHGTAAISQHLAHSVLRAVENGRYLVRSANMGINCVISPQGERVEEVHEGFVTAQVRPMEGKTLYTRGGDAMILMFCLFILHWTFRNQRRCKDKQYFGGK